MAKKEEAVFNYIVSAVLIIAGLCLMYFTGKIMFVYGYSIINNLVFLIGLVLMITGINIIRVWMGKKEIKFARAGPSIKEHSVSYQWIVAAIFGLGLILLIISIIEFKNNPLWKIAFVISLIAVIWAITTARLGRVLHPRKK